ncbi:MAG: hypothetical protein Q9218_001931 [Villophora microphyllina]
MGDGTHRSPSLRRHRIQHLAGKTKKITKRVFSASKSHSGQEDLVLDDNPAIKLLEEDAAFNLKQLDTEHKSDKGLATKAKANLQAVAAGIANPKEAIKGKATRTTAGQLSKVERPYLSTEMDQELLEAHDELSRAQSSASSYQMFSGHDADLSDNECKARVERIEAHRESLRAAYTTSTSVQRVRVVPKRHIGYPSHEDFVTKGEGQGDATRDWLKWIGHLVLWYTQDFSSQYIDDFDQLPFDVDSLRMHVQRLVVASGPWQTFFMDVRKVYRWEDPRYTAKWLAVYLILWYTQHVMGFLYGYIIYMIVKNRYYPSSVDAMRDSMRRSHDQRGSAFRFGELLEKHGHNHWLEPLLDELGPFIQLQTNDVANLLEVFSNFTTLPGCLLINYSSDRHGLLHEDHYVHLWRGFLLLLADLKSLPEIPHLRRNGQITRENLIERAAGRIYQQETYEHVLSIGTNNMHSVPGIVVNDTSASDDEDWHSASSATSILDGSDIAAYLAISHGVVGKLIIYAAGIRFVRSIKRKELWRRSFLELAEVRKKHGSSLSKLPRVSSHSLELKFIDGSRTALEGMKERDSAFNTIIGFSGLQWQSLQTETIHEGA